MFRIGCDNDKSQRYDIKNSKTYRVFGDQSKSIVKEIRYGAGTIEGVQAFEKICFSGDSRADEYRGKAKLCLDWPILAAHYVKDLGVLHADGVFGISIGSSELLTTTLYNKAAIQGDS